MVSYSRTLRIHAQSDEQRFPTTFVSDMQSAAVLWGEAMGWTYLRVTTAQAEHIGFALPPGAVELPPKAEIFVLTLPNNSDAAALAQFLTGPGGLAGVGALWCDGCELLVEVAGDIAGFFLLVDHCARGLAVRRRPVVALHDATLLAVASWMWNAPDFDPLRILEVAAGETPL